MLCWVREGDSLRQLIREDFPNQLLENGQWYARFNITDLHNKALMGYLYQPMLVRVPNSSEEIQLAEAIRAAKSLENNATFSFDITPSPPPPLEQGFGKEGNKQAAEEVRNLHKHYNENINQSVRQLAFAGIAVVWLFKVNASNTINLPRSFIWPLLLFVITLALDFIHFVVGSLLFGRSISTLFAKWTNPQGLSDWHHKFYRKEEVQGMVLMGSPILRG